MILAGDVGGTNTRLALFDKGKLVAQVRKFRSKEYNQFEQLIQEYLLTETNKIEKACFGIAGPFHEGVFKMTNLPWIVDAKQISQTFSIPSVYLLNDLLANAYGIKVLKKEETVLLQVGKDREGNQALISAGTGLGEAGLFWDGRIHHPFACEGGHTDFGPRNSDEVDLLIYLKKKFKRVSYEKVISGPGLYSIFQFLIDTGKETFSESIRAEMNKRDPAKVIAEYGRQNKDKACTRALDWFISLYGAEAGNLALKFYAIGGIYIGGGIAPSLVEKMKNGVFLSSFSDKEPFQSLLETIPIRVITNENTALLGAAYFAANH